MVKLSTKVGAVLWSMKLTDVRALLRSREWSDWMTRNLQSAREISGGEKQKLVKDLIQVRRKTGSARSFEHDTVFFGAFLEVILSYLRSRSVDKIYLVIGSSDSPSIFILQIDELAAVLQEVGRKESTAIVALESADGMVSIDPPSPELSVGPLLLSAVGSLTAIIDCCVRGLPGGYTFDGN